VVLSIFRSEHFSISRKRPRFCSYWPNPRILDVFTLFRKREPIKIQHENIFNDRKWPFVCPSHFVGLLLSNRSGHPNKMFLSWSGKTKDHQRPTESSIFKIEYMLKTISRKEMIWSVAQRSWLPSWQAQNMVRDCIDSWSDI
jgi:hypothetical protein